MDKKTMLQAELLELDKKLDECRAIEKPDKTVLLKVNATCDRIEAVQTELRALTVSESEPRFTQDKRSSDERLHRIGEYLQALAAASCDDPSRRFGQFRAGQVATEVIGREQRAVTGMGLQPSLGGFLVGETLGNEVLMRVEQNAVLWPLCRHFNLDERTNSIRIPFIDEESRVTGNRLGGVSVAWLGEAAEKAESKPKLGAVELALRKAAAICTASDEILQDSGVLAELIVTAFGQEVAAIKDSSVLRGPGANQPLGVLNAPCLVSVTGAGCAATILSEDVRNVWARLHPSCRKNSVWVINPDCLPELMDMGSAPAGAGTGTPLWLPANQMQGAPYSTMFGRRVVESEHSSTVGTVGDIILGDFSTYITIERPLAIASSIHLHFSTDETTFRLVFRGDGQPWWASSLTPAQGSNSLSCFVTIATR